MWLQPGIKLKPTYVLPDLLTFLVNLPLSKSGYIISHRSPLHKGLFWPSIPLEGHSNLSPLSLPRNLGVALLLLDIYCGNRSRLLCAPPPHRVRVRLVLSRLGPVHRGCQRCNDLNFVFLGSSQIFQILPWIICKLTKSTLFDKMCLCVP